MCIQCALNQLNEEAARGEPHNVKAPSLETILEDMGIVNRN